MNEGNIIIDSATNNFGLNREIIKNYFDNIPEMANRHDRFIQGSFILNERSYKEISENNIILVENNLEISSEIHLVVNKPMTIIAKGNVSINELAIVSGPLELISASFIEVLQEAKVGGVVLTAEDSILVESGVVFSGQIISSGMIKVEGGAQIRYPSLIYSFYPGYHSGHRNITLENNSLVESITVMDSTLDKTEEYYNRIILENQALITGVILSDEYIELKGKLNGIALANQFIYLTDRSVYVNWLRNASIDRTELDFIPVMPINTEGLSSYGIFKKYN